MKERPILFSAEMVRAILEDRKTMTRRVVKDISSRADGEWHPFIGPNDKQTGEWFFTTKTHAHVIDQHRKCPYGQPGDRLWVRETWGVSATYAHRDHTLSFTVNVSQCSALDAPNPKWPNLINYLEPTYIPGSNCGVGGLVHRWRPSIHMPRWASRILLEVVSVRVERLQDISIMDCLSEGIRCPECGYTAKDAGMHMDHAICVNKWLQACKAGNESDHAAIVAYRELWNSLYTKEPEKQWGANPWVWVIEFKRVSQ